MQELTSFNKSGLFLSLNLYLQLFAKKQIMKKTILMGFVALAFIGFTSCKKFAANNTQDVSNTEETVNVSINTNQVYKFALPAQANAANVTVAGAASKSNIAIVDSSNISTFVYTPDQNFSGTQVVTITHPQHADKGGNCDHHGKGKHHEGQGNCANHNEHHGGHCDKGGDQHPKQGEHKITFNITVKSLLN